MPGLGGLFIQEAQARGCPVISAAADGTEQDLVRAVNPELYVDKTNARSFAAIFERLAHDPELLLLCRRRAFAVVRDSYNLDVMAENWTAGVLATWGRAAGEGPAHREV
jgi:glycosyltransferase involved in cell wall biosynthesis